MPVDPTETRESIIFTAERLFAEKGLGSVSLREILSHAGQRNKSAANYHFGNKQGLVDAIFDYRMGPLDTRRMERLEALDHEHRGRDLRGLLEAFVYPLAEQVGEVAGSFYARFVAQVVFIAGVEPFTPARIDVTKGATAILEGLNRILRGLPDEVRDARIRAALGVAFQALADHERRLETGTATTTTLVVASNVVDMQEVILLAPVSTSTRRHLRLARSIVR